MAKQKGTTGRQARVREEPRARSLILYHGTNATFDRFEKRGIVSGREMGDGIYLTKDPDRARGYGTRLITAKIELKNTIVIDSDKKIGKVMARNANKYLDGVRVYREETIESVDVARERYETLKSAGKFEQMRETNDGKIVIGYYEEGVTAETSEGRLYRTVRREYPETSSVVLQELGYEGIEGSRDVVVFDPGNIDIVESVLY